MFRPSPETTFFQMKLRGKFNPKSVRGEFISVRGELVEP